MNLSIVWITLLLAYKLFTQKDPFSFLEIDSVNIADSVNATARPKNFSLVDLIDIIFTTEKIGETKESQVLNYTFQLDKPDLFFYDEFDERHYFLYLSQISEESSHLVVKSIRFGPDFQIHRMNMEVENCFSTNLTGRVVNMFHSDNKVVIQSEVKDSEGTLSQMLTLIQSIQCFEQATHHSRFMIRDDSLMLETNLSSRMKPGVRLTRGSVYNDVLYTKTEDGNIYAIQLWRHSIVQILPEMVDCHGIVDVRPLKDKLVIICYRPEGLYIHHELLVIYPQYYRGHIENWGMNEEVYVLHRERLPESRKWRSEREYLQQADEVLLSGDRSCTLALVTFNKWMFQIAEDSQFRNKIVVLRKNIPVSNPTSLHIIGDKQAYITVERESGSQLLAYSIDPAQHHSEKHTTYQFTASLPSIFQKHLTIFRLTPGYFYSLTMDDSSGLVLHHIVTEDPFHTSTKGLLTVLYYLSLQLFKVYLFDAVFRVGMETLKRRKEWWTGGKVVKVEKKDDEKKEILRMVEEMSLRKHEALWETRKVETTSVEGIETAEQEVFLGEDILIKKEK